MKTQIATSSGRVIDLPLFDPNVAAHVANPASLVDTLIHQINEEQIYARFFQGWRDLTFLDIGANIGLVSIYASDACKRIVAIEPAPETFAVLMAMVLKFPQIEPVQAALAPKDGPCEFFTNDLNSTASSTVNTYGKLGTVQGMTLTSLLSVYQLEHVDICKCDAEGAEGESLSLNELLNAKDIIRTYMIETHNCPLSTWQDKMGRLVRDLVTVGYHITEINGMALTATRSE